MFDNFLGNPDGVQMLEQMIEQDRIPQTILLSGPEGVGKATLARRFAARLLGGAAKIEQDDVSLESNKAIITDREKWPADKRNEDPLLFSSHPDFITFPPDGPLRQISIQQMRLLKDRAQYNPMHGSRRVFLIDGIDRANEQASNSLLKTLEEPPPYLVIIMTANNPYDLLVTIRSRAVMLRLSPLAGHDVLHLVRERKLGDPDRRVHLACGSPGRALSIDLESYDKRRGAMLTLLQVAARQAPFSRWVRFSESIGASKSEKLELYLDVLYVLLEDLLLVRHHTAGVRNADIRTELEIVANSVSFGWIHTAVRRVDEFMELLRRNIQKGIALDALVAGLQRVS